MHSNFIANSRNDLFVVYGIKSVNACRRCTRQRYNLHIDFVHNRVLKSGNEFVPAFFFYVPLAGL